MVVLEMMRRTRMFGGTATLGRKRRKTASKPVAIPFKNTPLLMMLVIEMMRRVRVFSAIAASRRLYNTPVLMMLVVEMMRRVRMSGRIAASRRLDNTPLVMMLVYDGGFRVFVTISASGGVHRIKTASEPVIIPLLDSKGGRRRDKPHQGNDRNKHDEKFLHFE